MSDEQGAGSNVSVGGGKIDGDHLDLDALREMSVEQYDKEFPQEAKKAKPQPKKKEAPVEEAPEEEAEDETFEASDAEEQEDSEEEPEEEEESEDEEEDAEEDEPEEEEVEQKGKYATAKSKDGKTYKVPKDAVFEVKVNGKKEELPLQEIINRASGATDLDRKYMEFAKKEQVFTEKARAFERQAEDAKDNLEMIMNIARNGTPEDLAQYYGLLTNQEPAKVLQDLLERTISYAEQFSQMTDRERELYNENRKFKFQTELGRIKQGKAAQTESFQKERAEVENALKSQGLTMDDFFAAANDVRQKLSEGKLNGKFSALDIVDYAAGIRHEKSVKSAISSVNKSLLFDRDFVAKISKAVASAESVSGDKFSDSDIRNLVKSVIDDKKKGLSESLSRKVDRHNKSGKTNSQKVSSRNQEKKSGGGVTLRDHYDRIWGDG